MQIDSTLALDTNASATVRPEKFTKTNKTMSLSNMMRTQQRIGFILIAAALLCLPVKAATVPPGLTQGGKPDNEHRWTLGATGARGWLWSRYLAGGSENTDARQILITEVAKGSPADGVLEIGDVVTGLNEQPFSGDARLLFAQAVTEAEKETSGGVLKLLRWRKGKTESVQLKLRVMGTYAAKAPYGCAKSKRLFEQGCEAIAKRGLKDEDNNLQVSIENDMNALALLASGREEYRPILAEYAQKVATHRPKLDDLPTWEYAYNTVTVQSFVPSLAPTGQCSKAQGCSESCYPG